MPKKGFYLLCCCSFVVWVLTACSAIPDPAVGTLLCTTVEDAKKGTNCTTQVGEADANQMLVEVADAEVGSVKLLSRAQSFNEAPVYYFKLSKEQVTGNEGNQNGGQNGGPADNPLSGIQKILIDVNEGFPWGYVLAAIVVGTTTYFLLYRFVISLTLEHNFQIAVPRLTCAGGVEIDNIILSAFLKPPTDADGMAILQQLKWAGVEKLLTSRVQQWIRTIAIQVDYQNLASEIAKKCEDPVLNGLVLPNMGALFEVLFVTSLDLPVDLQAAGAAKHLARLDGDALLAFMQAAGETDLTKAARAYFLKKSGERGLVRIELQLPNGKE